MFKILNTALTRKLEIINCSGKLTAQKNGICYFEISKENKILKLKCSEGIFNKHFKTDFIIDTTAASDKTITDKEYKDIMTFYS